MVGGGPGIAQQTAVLPLATLEKPWYKYGHLVKLNFYVAVCVLSSFAAGYDGALITGLLTIDSWFAAMDAYTSQLIGLLAMTGVIGLAAGAWLGGFASDRIGRPKVILGSAAVMVLGAGMCAIEIADSPFHQRILWSVSRVLISFASGSSAAIAPALIAEVAYPTHRPVASALYWCGFYLGSVTAAWVAFGCNGISTSWAWRLPCLLQGLASMVQLPCAFFLPESPRFLAANDREEEAALVLAKHHVGSDDVNHPLIQAQMSEIHSALNMDALGKSTSITGLFKGKGNLHRLWIIVSMGFFTQWVGNGVVTYYLPDILATVGVPSTRHQAAFNGGIQIFNLFAATIAATQAERFGRRKLFFVSGFGMLISFVLITALSASYAKTANASVGRAVIAMLFLFDLSYDIALTPLAIAYPIEILPYRFRAKGMAIQFTMICAALTFNIYVNPIGLAAITWKLYLVYIVVICAFIISVYFTYPETKGCSVEAIEAIFDGDKADIIALDGDEKKVSTIHIEDNKREY